MSGHGPARVSTSPGSEWRARLRCGDPPPPLPPPPHVVKSPSSSFPPYCFNQMSFGAGFCTPPPTPTTPSSKHLLCVVVTLHPFSFSFSFFFFARRALMSRGRDQSRPRPGTREPHTPDGKLSAETRRDTSTRALTRRIKKNENCVYFFVACPSS